MGAHGGDASPTYLQKMSASLKKKRKLFDKPRNAGSDESAWLSLDDAECCDAIHVQAENCPRDRHLLRQRLRPTVLRAAPQNAGRQSGRLQELNAANLDVHTCSGTSGDGARFGCRAKSSPDDLRDSSFRSMLAPLSGSLKLASETLSSERRYAGAVSWAMLVKERTRINESKLQLSTTS